MKSNIILRSFDEYLIESLRDPAEAQAYLEVTLDEYILDHDVKILEDSLHTLATARNGLLKGPALSDIDSRELDSILSETQIIPWDAVLEALGMEFSSLATESLPAY